MNVLRIAAALAALSAFASALTAGTVTASNHHRVLIELYTSQG